MTIHEIEILSACRFEGSAEALVPYPDDLVIVTKIGARGGEDGSWLPAYGADELARAVDDNLRNLALEALDVVQSVRRPRSPAMNPWSSPCRAGRFLSR